MSISKEIKCYDDLFKQSLEHLVSFVAKESGEMIKSVYIDKDEHWKNELGDLCGLVIPPLLKKAGLTFEEAQEIGRKRFEEKIIYRKNKIYLKEISKEIKTQDNMITANPIFILFDHETVPTDSDYSDEILYCWDGFGDWCEIGTTKESVIEFCKDNNIQLPEEIDDDEFEIHFDDFIEKTKGFHKVHYLKKRIYKQCFFTKKSAEEYLKANKHHFNDPLIWCDTLWRNYEMQTIRNALIEGKFK